MEDNIKLLYVDLFCGAGGKDAFIVKYNSMNDSNQLQVLVCKIMYREGVGYMEALSMAKDELEKRKEATGMTADPNTEWND